MTETTLSSVFRSVDLEVIQAEALLNLVEGFDGDAQDAVDIINDWLEEIPPMINDTKVAFDDGNADKVKHSAHAVKSAARSVGAMDLADMAEILQKKGAEASLTIDDEQLLKDYVDNAALVVKDLHNLKTHLLD